MAAAISMRWRASSSSASSDGHRSSAAATSRSCSPTCATRPPRSPCSGPIFLRPLIPSSPGAREEPRRALPHVHRHGLRPLSAVGGGEVAAAPARSATVRTFLICDVRGYTRFTQQHGDEAAADLAAAFAELVRAASEGMTGRRSTAPRPGAGRVRIRPGALARPSRPRCRTKPTSPAASASAWTPGRRCRWVRGTVAGRSTWRHACAAWLRPDRSWRRRPSRARPHHARRALHARPGRAAEGH